MRAYLQERKWLKESRLTKAHHSMCDGSQNWGPGVCHSLQASQQARVSPPGEKTRPSSSSWGRCRAHAQVYLPGNFQTQPLSCSPLDEVSSQLILASRGQKARDRIKSAYSTSLRGTYSVPTHPEGWVMSKKGRGGGRGGVLLRRQNLFKE